MQPKDEDRAVGGHALTDYCRQRGKRQGDVAEHFHSGDIDAVATNATVIAKQLELSDKKMDFFVVFHDIFTKYEFFR